MSTQNSSDNSKKKVVGRPFPKGTSGNPGGRPKKGNSWAQLIQEVMELTPAEVQKLIGTQKTDLRNKLAKLPQHVKLKFLIVARGAAFMAAEPNSSLLDKFMDRTDGKVIEKIARSDMTWQELMEMDENPDDTNAEDGSE